MKRTRRRAALAFARPPESWPEMTQEQKEAWALENLVKPARDLAKATTDDRARRTT